MAIVTFLSDFGTTDHYVSAVKARIMSLNSGVKIVDITHDIESCDIAHAAYVLGSVFREFPKGTVHIVAVHTSGQPNDKFIAVELEGHYFIATDNGLLGLISDSDAVFKVDVNSIKPIETSFPAKQIFAPAAVKLASGSAIQDLGRPIDQYKRMMNRHLKANKRLISGHVIRVDHYGNAITNIDKHAFEILSKDKNYNITFGRENTRRIQNSYNQVEAGDVFVLFNDGGFLEIGVSQGNASELLGLRYDSPVMVTFDE